MPDIDVQETTCSAQEVSRTKSVSVETIADLRPCHSCKGVFSRRLDAEGCFASKDTGISL